MTSRYNCRVRVAFVGYRDHCDGQDRIESTDFGTVEEFKIFLEGVRATGGGDECEDVHGGLEAALNLSWGRKNRCLIHIADAPAHGSRFHAGCNDSYATYNDADFRGLRIEDLIRKTRQLGIDYTFGKINSSTDVMISVFNQIGGEDFVSCSDMADVKNFPFVAVESISATIENNWRDMVGAVRPAAGATRLSAISEKSSIKTLKPYRIATSQPDWRRIPSRKVRIGRCIVSLPN